MAFTTRCPTSASRPLACKSHISWKCPTITGSRRNALGASTTCRALNQEPSGRVQPGLGSCLAAVAAAALLGVAPMEAQAVSGGGGISTPLSGEDFSNKDLTRNKYTKAVLRKTNFSNSNLSGVSLFGCLAEGANFSGANLTNADLESGNFEGADFTNAILAGAFMNNAQLQGAKFDNTDWSDVVLRKDMQQFLCSKASGTNPTTGVDTKESLLCAP